MRILQLSDIHLTKQEQTAHDPDRELRWQLPRAIRAAAREAKIDLVLVTGDVAFSGSREEYGVATDLVHQVTAAIDVPPEMIYVIPGNHDIDRKKADSALQRELRSGLRNRLSLPEQDARLRQIANDAVEARRLMEPLDEYTRFAERFACGTSAAEPCWHHSLVLCERLELVLHGLNSALASHVHDDEVDEPLIVGTVQTQFEPGDGRVDLALCHHPPAWVKFGPEIQSRLERALLYITGHIHEYGAVGTPGGVWLRAGALQPSRTDDEWQPHFSLIDIAVGDEIKVIIEPWPWDPTQGEFVPGPSKTFPLPLPVEALDPGRRGQIEHEQQLRRLIVHLAALPGSEITKAARDAGVTLTTALDSSPGALAAEAVEKADKANRRAALWEEMTERRNQNMENPFT